MVAAVNTFQSKLPIIRPMCSLNKAHAYAFLCNICVHIIAMQVLLTIGYIMPIVGELRVMFFVDMCSCLTSLYVLSVLCITMVCMYACS